MRDLGCNYLSNILFSDVVKGGNETIWKESMNEKSKGLTHELYPPPFHRRLVPQILSVSYEKIKKSVTNRDVHEDKL